MNFYIITIFPEIFEVLNTGVLGKALEKGVISFECVNPRDFTQDKHRTVDDEPYGGGAGMVMKPEPIVYAIEHVRKKEPEIKVLLLTPRGKTFNHKIAYELSKEKALCFVCGRYEGIDERVSFFVDDEVSIGDFILSGGEFAALCMIDAISRFVPDVLGSRDSLEEESFTSYLLEYPQYTRPPEFRGYKVPEILRSGNHREIAKWRRYQQLKTTLLKRADLLIRAKLSEEDKKFLEKALKEI